MMLFAALLSPPAAAQMQVEVIPLNYRTVDDVIPVLQPLLAPGGTITGMNNQLIIKTTPQNLAEITDVLQTIDRKMRRLMIAVRQDRGFRGSDVQQSVSGRATPGDVTIEQDETRANQGGLTTTIGDEDGDYARHRIVAGEARADDSSTFRVQGIEGRPAFIQAGTSVPLRYQTRSSVPGTVVQEGIEYHDATSGFYVVPLLNGDQVTLQVSPFMSDVIPGRVPSFQIQNVETTAIGRLGEWISLGGIDTQRQASDRQLVSGGRSSSFDNRNIQVQVTEIP